MDDGAEGYENKDTMTKPIQEIGYNVTSEGYIRVHSVHETFGQSRSETRNDGDRSVRCNDSGPKTSWLVRYHFPYTESSETSVDTRT
jgi:hypothetical protein